MVLLQRLKRHQDPYNVETKDAESREDNDHDNDLFQCRHIEQEIHRVPWRLVSTNTKFTQCWAPEQKAMAGERASARSVEEAAERCLKKHLGRNAEIFSEPLESWFSSAAL